MDYKKYLLGLCKVYKGEEKNPINQSDDEFKWHIWRTEKAAIADAEGKAFKDTDEADEHFKAWIRNACGDYASEWAGGDPTPYFNRYFGF